MGTAFGVEAWSPELDPQNPLKGGRKQLSPQSCPLTSPWHAQPLPHITIDLLKELYSGALGLGERIHAMWQMYAIEYYWIMKKDELMSFERK